MQDQTAISQRRACYLVGLSRSVLSYRSAKQHSDARLQGRLRELAEDRKRFGYRRLHVLLRRVGIRGQSQEGISIVSRGGAGRHDEKVRKTGQTGGDVLGEPFGKGLELCIPRSCLER